MIIGNFKHDAQQDNYRGQITTLTTHRADIQLVPVAKPTTSGPAYRMVAETELGAVEFGAAWRRIDRKGDEYLSVLIDDPSLSKGIYAALILAQESDEALLVWSRAPLKRVG